MTRDELITHLRSLLVEHFELDAGEITEEARLYDDLDIDSIDAVDLMVELKEITGRKIDPEDFKKVRTVGDVVDALQTLVNA